MAKNNALPPASQPWVRELERRIKELENKSYRTDSKVNVMSNRVMSPRVDLDALNVTEIRVGGDEPQVFEHEVQNYSISGNTITASTPPVPAQRGFIMEWEVDVTASVDYIQVSSTLDPEMYEDPEEPTGALAGEETTYFADASYMTEAEDSDDEMFNPVPPIVSFTLHNPAKTAFTFTVHAVRMRFIIPGEGGLRITQDGEIYFEDGAGHDRIIQEISEAQAQAIVETADNLAAAKQELDEAAAQARADLDELDDKLGAAFPGDNIFNVDLAIQQAKDLAQQQFNASIVGSLVEYARNSNETEAPTTGWSTTVPTRDPGTFIWMRTTISYGSGDTTTTEPVLLSGNDGLPGAPGVGITNTEISYARSTSGASAPASGWQEQPPSPIKGQFLWTRTIWTYTNNATETGYSSSYWATDGASGTDGDAGKDGTKLTGTVNHYAQSASGTTEPTSGWATQPPEPVPGMYMWTRSTWSYDDGTTEQGYTVGKIGDTGAEGVSISSIVPHFRRLDDSEVKPAIPSGMTPSGWSSTEPDYVRDTTMWRSDRIVFSNDQITWTEVSKSSSYEAAKAAEKAALDYAEDMRDVAIQAGAHDLANLKIGGRNLLQAAGGEYLSLQWVSPAHNPELVVEDGKRAIAFGSSNNIFSVGRRGAPVIPAGETITLSFWGKGSREMTLPRVYLGLGDGNIRYFGGADAVVPTEWKQFVVTYETVSELTVSLHMYPTISNGDGTYDTFYLSDMKLERGSKATDWTPAPEDIDAGIANAQADASTAVQRANEAVKDTKIEYAVNTSETTAPTSGWSTSTPTRTPGSYIWMRTTITYGDGTPAVLAPVLVTGNDGATGGKGDPGTPGVSVSSITPYFRQSASKPSQPSGAGTQTGWTITEPVYVSGTKLWRSERIVLSNSTVQWTPVTEVATYTGIDAAIDMASGKNAASYTDVADSVAAPGPTPSTTIGNGRRVHDMHRNRRSNGQIIGEWIWTGTDWTQLKLSDAMLTSLDVGLLSAGGIRSIDAVIQRLWVEGLVARVGTFSRAIVAAQNLIPGIEVLSQYGDLTPEEKNASPFRAFEINTTHPSLSLTGRASGWIWANIPVRAGERYRFSVDALSPTAVGARFSIRTLRANSDGGQGTVFMSWTDFKSSSNTSIFSSYPFNNTETGSSWTSYWSEMTATADGVISFLVEANISAGTTNTGPQYFRNFTMRSMTDGNMLVDGAVTARTLNVVPDGSTGGMELKPEGLRIIPAGADAGTAVSLRVDEENTIAFVKDKENTFAVNEFGDITGESLDVRGVLKENGVPLQEMLKALPQGYLGRAEMSGVAVHMGTEAGRVVMVSIRTPSENRLMKVTVSLRPNVNAVRHAEVTIRQSEGEDVKVTNSQRKVWPVSLPAATGWEASQVFTVDEWGWPYDKTITLGVFVKSITANQTIQFSSNHGQTITVEDVGLPLELQTNNAYVPTSTGGGSGGSGGETDKEKRYYDGKFYPASSQSYQGGNAAYNWNKSMLFHGYNLSANGRLRSMAIFNRAAVETLTKGTGTEMVSGHIKLYNSHTWANAGMTVRVGRVSSYETPPDTWNGTTNFTLIGSYTVSRGGVLTIPLTSTLLAQVKSGGFRGIGLVSNTDTASHYGYFNAGKTELYIKVRK